MKKSTCKFFALFFALLLFSSNSFAVDYEYLIDDDVRLTIQTLTENSDLRKIYYAYGHLISEMASNLNDEDYLLKIGDYTLLIHDCISKYPEGSGDHLIIIESETINTYEEIKAYIGANVTISGKTFGLSSKEEADKYCSHIVQQ